ncbi:MAG: hypothetical protein ABI180_03840 [Microcoleus sp.]
MTTKLRATDTEKMEIDLQQLRADQELILNQVDNAIALFDSSDCLVLFNKKLAETWGLSSEWLATKPKCDLLFAEIVDRGYLSVQQWNSFSKHCKHLRMKVYHSISSNPMQFVWKYSPQLLTAAGGCLPFETLPYTKNPKLA